MLLLFSFGCGRVSGNFEALASTVTFVVATDSPTTPNLNPKL